VSRAPRLASPKKRFPERLSSPLAWHFSGVGTECERRSRKLTRDCVGRLRQWQRQFASAERYFLRAGTGTRGFVEADIAALAPARTVAVQCQVLLNACGIPTGSLIVDDAVLKIGPIPAGVGGVGGG